MSLGGVLERSGSSPRGRGKRSGRTPRERRKRLIPAWAGKTTQRQSTARPSPAHPRVGGENESRAGSWQPWWGSSPRGRGKLPCASRRESGSRLIPAWAGKTLSAWLQMVSGLGSSPRGRGKPDSVAELAQRIGLIPAWAGKTRRGRGCAPGLQAHPRVGGENRRSSVGLPPRSGSSPRGRGKRADATIVYPERGLIPAWAGKTWWRRACWRPVPAHPRVGGEN